MFESPRPLDGLAEYACAKESLVEMRPDSISPACAASLTSSALAAFHAVQHVKRGSRVLILGGSGGVGTFLIQLTRNAGACYIATTSTDEQLCHDLGADYVINYKRQNFWDIPAFKKDPFDVIFDLGVGRYDAWKQAKDSKILNNGWNGGKYVTVSGDEPEMIILNLWQTCRFVGGVFGRVAWTTLWRWDPSYVLLSNALDVTPGIFQVLTQLVEDKKLKVVFHPSQLPFKLDLESVKRGFHIMNKRAGHGKVIIHNKE
jgi:NADPH:quinone reductase-like Zn-dependent oxidoreductase